MNLKIEQNKYYSASSVLKNGFFPWFKADYSFREWLIGKQGRELLNPVIRRAGKKTMLYVKGEKLLELHKLADDGKLIITTKNFIEQTG